MLNGIFANFNPVFLLQRCPLLFLHWHCFFACTAKFKVSKFSSICSAILSNVIGVESSGASLYFLSRISIISDSLTYNFLAISESFVAYSAEMPLLACVDVDVVMSYYLIVIIIGIVYLKSAK